MVASMCPESKFAGTKDSARRWGRAMIKLAAAILGLLAFAPCQQAHDQAPEQPFAARVWAAAAQKGYQQALRQVAADCTVAELVDAIVGDGRALRGHLWARIGSTLLPDQELELLWLQAPKKRRVRGPVFAMSRMRWPRRLAKAGAGERADIEHIAQFLRASDQGIERAMFGRDAKVAQAARELRRIAVRAELARPQPELQRIVDTPLGTPDDAPKIYPTSIAHDVFALGRFLEDERPHVRAAAAVVLRQKLRLRVPLSVREALRQHPNFHLRWQQTNVPLARADQNARQRIEAVGAGGDPDQLLPVAYVAQQTDKVRAEIGMVLMRAGLRVPLAAVPKVEHCTLESGLLYRAAQLPEDARAIALMTRAAKTGDRVAGLILALARPGQDLRLRLRVLLAIAYAATAVDVELVAELLEDRDPAIAFVAAQIAAQVLHEDGAERAPMPGLRATVAAKALGVLNGGAKIQAEPYRRAPRCTQDRPPLIACDANSLMVWVAALQGSAALIDPLIQRLAAKAPPVGHGERALVMACLVRLAPLANAKQAGRLWALLSNALPARDARIPIPVPDETRILSGLVAVLPQKHRDHLLDLAVAGHGELICLGVAAAGDRVPDAVAEAFVEKLGLDSHSARPLLGRCPNLLLEAWQAGGESRRCMLSGISRGAIVDWERWLVVMRGWPDDMVLDVTRWTRDMPTPPLEFVARLGKLPAHELGIARWLWAKPDRRRASDLMHLKQLAQHKNWQVAHAAAWRSQAIGEAGQELFRSTMSRLLAYEDLLVVQNLLSVMVRNNVAAPGWQGAAERLRKHAGRAVVADQAMAKFGGVAIESVAPASRATVLAESGVAVAHAELKHLLGEQDVSAVLRSSSAVTVASALQILAQRTAWSQGLQKLVVAKLVDGDARVRLAAYEALATRDRELFAHAWLVYEAAFDSDAAVRDVIGRVKRLTK